MQPHNEGEVTVSGMHFRYLGYGRVKLAIDTKAGEAMSFIISTRTMAHSINSAIACLKNNGSPVLRELARIS